MSRLAVFFFLLAALALPINGFSSRNLEEIIQNKCAECKHPPPPPYEPECPPPPPPSPPPLPPYCPPLPPSPPPPLPSPPQPIQLSPPPPIVLSPPPPMIQPYPPSPPPPPVLPAPPPPFVPPPPGDSGSGLYITNPGGQLYPVVHPLSGAENQFAVGLPLLTGGLLFLGLFMTY